MTTADIPECRTPPDTLHAAERGEFANFDYLRLFAAVCVLLHHSIFIAERSDKRDPMVWLFGQDIPTGTYAVCIFFIISGFLVTKSARSGQSLGAFVAGRALRIYPGLFVCQLLTAVIIGGAYSYLHFGDYLTVGHPFFYALHYTLDPGMTWRVPTVKFYGDPDLGVSFNASLWSIQQELVCYVIVALLMALRLVGWRSYAMLIALSLPFFVPWSRDDADVIMNAINWTVEEQRFTEFFWVGSSFFAGGILYFWWARDKRFPAWPLIACAALCVIAVLLRRPFDFFPLYAAYPLLYWATSTTRQLPSLKRVGDLSFGMYLYGWPFQQVARAVIGPDVAWWMVFAFAVTASAATAYLSWHLIERPALSLKRRFRR